MHRPGHRLVLRPGHQLVVLLGHHKKQYRAAFRRPKKKKTATALEAKNERIEDIIMKSLRDAHKEKYTTIQYRLWAEMIDVGTHTSFD